MSDWPPGDSEMAARIRHFDWASTPLGPIETWPTSLRLTLTTILDNPVPMALAWGPALCTLYGEAYRPLLGDKAEALGRSFLDVWMEARDTIAPQMAHAMAGVASRFEGARFDLSRGGHPQEAFFDYCFSPVRDESGAVVGVLNIALEVTARYADAAQLEESENRLRTVLDGINERFYVLDKDWRFLFASRSALQAWGKKQEDVVGHLFLDSFPEAEGSRPYELHRRVMRTGVGERLEAVSPVLRRWIEMDIAPTPQGGLSVGFRDIEVRKRAEDGLRRSEERLTIALEAGRMGTYRLDLATGGQEWSAGQYEIFGLPAGTVPTRELFMSLVHPEDHHLVSFSTEDIRKPGTYLDSEFRIIRPDGQVRCVIAHALAVFGPDGHPAELIGVNQDVTEQRRLEAAMHASEERLQQFSDASSDILWIRRADNLQWEYLSPAFHRIYGISRQDAMRGDNLQSWSNLIVPEDREKALAGIARVRAGKRATFEYRVLRPEDGEIRWLRNTDFPMRDEAGDVVRIGGIGHDLTELKRAEEHQRLLLSELQHRVRNTLAVIRSIVRRTAATTDDKDEFFTHLDGRIAAFARVQAAVTRDPANGLDLAFLVAEELHIVGGNEGTNVKIVGPAVNLAPKAAESLGIAIHELATNAMKYGALTIDRGRIDVAWRIVGSGSEAQLQFSWTERGLHNLPPHPSHEGFGTEVLKRTLSYELDASTALSFGPNGLECLITIPMSELVL